MSLQLVSGPADGDVPVTLDDVKLFAGISGTERDVLLTELLASAVVSIEEILGRALATQTWQLGLEEFAAEMPLPRGPVQSIVSIKYRDRSGVEQTLGTSSYVLDMVSDPARVVRADGAAWPALGGYPTPVLIRFVTGYPSAADVPGPIKTAIKMTVLSLFENRSAGDVPAQAVRLLEPWRTGWILA